MPASPFTELVAENVRAEMGRARLSGVQLAAMIKKTHPYVSRRLTGKVAFDTDDLVLISDALHINVLDLMRAPERAA
jgi:hypothetical protein